MRLVCCSSLVAMVLVLSACVNQLGDVASSEEGSQGEQASAKVANPAAAKCVAEGYKLVSAGTLAEGSTLMCVDTDSGQKCPVWPFFRQECLLPERAS